MMDESSRLRPERLKEQSNSAIGHLEADNELLQESLTTAENFINDERSHTGGLSNIKLKMEDYRAAVNGFIKANNADIQDHRKLKLLVGTLELNGREIIRNQNERREAISHSEAQLRRYRRRLALSVASSLLSPPLAIKYTRRMQRLVTRYEDRLRSAEAALAIWEEREQMYNDIEQASKELFTTGREMREKSKLGVGHIRAATPGLPNSFESEALTSWRINIQEKKETTATRKDQSREVLEELEAQAARIHGRFRITDEPIVPLWDASIYEPTFFYDPNATATIEDYFYWMLWRVIMEGERAPDFFLQMLEDRGIIDFIVPGGEDTPRSFQDFIDEDISDAKSVFNHYRRGDGADYFINLENGFNDDRNVRDNILTEIRDMQIAVENLSGQTGLNEFNVSSDLDVNFGYPVTRNWQKTLGNFHMWSYAEVRYVNGEFQMTVTVYTVDRYDFNDGQNSMGSMVPDEFNGRFEELGWADSFNTFGEMTFEITWSEGEIITWENVFNEDNEIVGWDLTCGNDLIIQDGSGR